MKTSTLSICLSTLLLACQPSEPPPAPEPPQLPTCTDAVKNADEADTDCGGSCSQKCANGQNCGSASDCTSTLCVAGLCIPLPTCTDGKRNGGESDKDCGGASCAKCAVSLSCAQDSDCQTGNCDAGACAEVVTLSTIAPALGPTGTATAITLTGTGFKPGQGVTIGGVMASGVLVTSMTQLQATAPAAPVAGLVDVVLGYAGNKSASLSKAFRYYWSQVGLNSPALTSTSGGTEGVILADVNGDGKPDMLSANFSGNNITVFQGNGDGTFKTGVNYSGGSKPTRIAVGDLNGDGKRDVVVTNFQGSTLSVLLNNGDGTFAAAVPYPAGSSSVGLVVADLNGDGKLDVANAYRSGGTNVSVFLGNGDGTLMAKVDYAAGPSPYGLVGTDLNGDGRPDLISSNNTGAKVSVLLNNGDGTFKTNVDYAVSFTTFDLVAGDFTGDGKSDIAVTSNGGTNFAVLPSMGDGTLLAPIYTTSGTGIQAISAADFNQDGLLDAVLLNDGGANILLGKGNGGFQTAITAAGIGSGYTVAVGNVDGDGKIDIVGANFGALGVFLGTAQ